MTPQWHDPIWQASLPDSSAKLGDKFWDKIWDRWPSPYGYWVTYSTPTSGAYNYKWCKQVSSNFFLKLTFSDQWNFYRSILHLPPCPHLLQNAGSSKTRNKWNRMERNGTNGMEWNEWNKWNSSFLAVRPRFCLALHERYHKHSPQG